MFFVAVKMRKLASTGKALYGMFICLAVLGCTSTATTIGDAEQQRGLRELIESKAYRFTATRAYPMPSQAFNAIANSGILPPGSNSGVIDLTVTPNFVEVHGDSLAGDLPFFGERQLGGGPGTTAGIHFNGKPKKYEAAYNGKQKRFDIKFTTEGDQDVYIVILRAYANGRADMSVLSNQRTAIQYDGNITAIKTEGE